MSKFLINASVSESEKIVLEGIDDIVALGRFFSGATTQGVRKFTLPTPKGGIVQSRLRPDWRDGSARWLQGRALDLKSAYKQLARHPDDDWTSILTVYDPSKGRVMYVESLALPFGATPAVTGFNRAARALTMILCRLAHLTNSNYFDDFLSA